MSELIPPPKALCTGEDTFNGIKIIASILDNEERTHIFSERSLANVFGFKGGGAYWKRKKTDSAVLPEYLSSPLLKDFISSDLKEKLDSAVSYIATNGKYSQGIEATVLPLICDVYYKASIKHKDNEGLKKAGETAYKIILAFSQYGVLKYVEQITGYRYTDEDIIIAKQLKEWGVSPTIVDWGKEFQTEFYRHIYRLKGWDFNPKTVKKPQVIGTYTNKYIYSYLPADVFSWIKENTPKSKAGNKTARYFQSLDDKKGKEIFRNQLVSVTTLLKISKSWADFENKMMELFGQTAIDFPEPNFYEAPKQLPTSGNKELDEAFHIALNKTYKK